MGGYEGASPPVVTAPKGPGGYLRGGPQRISPLRVLPPGHSRSITPDLSYGPTSENNPRAKFGDPPSRTGGE